MITLKNIKKFKSKFGPYKAGIIIFYIIEKLQIQAECFQAFITNKYKIINEKIPVDKLPEFWEKFKNFDVMKFQEPKNKADKEIFETLMIQFYATSLLEIQEKTGKNLEGLSFIPEKYKAELLSDIAEFCLEN